MRDAVLSFLLLEHQRARNLFLFCCLLAALALSFFYEFREIAPLIFVVIGVGLSVSISYLYDDFALAVFPNCRHRTRVKRISDLLATCESEVVIVSGEFNHGVYNEPEILHELANLPDGVSVSLYRTEAKVDPESDKFLALVEKKGWQIKETPAKTAHVVIVDRKNMRFELTDKKKGLAAPIHTGDKYGLVFYSEPALAKKTYNHVMTSMAA